MVIHDIERRLKEDEWNYLQKKYPYVAFNYKGFGANGKLNSPENGCRILYPLELPMTMPEQWKPEIFERYDGIITFNSKFAHDNKNLNIKLVNGVLACNNYYHLDNHLDYEARIPGVAVLLKLYYTGREGDIVWLRQEAVESLSNTLPVHVWSTDQWGGRNYQGVVKSPIHHSHINHLKKINEYRFCICFEPVYHEYWGWDFITERMFNCFKAKTVPIYIGCHNIEQYVPKELFVDFREFYTPEKRDYNKLSECLLGFPKSKWEDMTEKAFEWNKTNRIGNVEDLEGTIADFGI